MALTTTSKTYHERSHENNGRKETESCAAKINSQNDAKIQPCPYDIHVLHFERANKNLNTLDKGAQRAAFYLEDTF